ncbi:MAG: hypothetical protein LBQ30_01910 [Treponema sp.]|jgi:hypothetical protein|nr:hypothetical protein [Treponema sp.]
MKKGMGLLWCVCVVGCLWAEKPRRYVELGFQLESGFANNYLGYRDIFNDDKIIRLNFNEMGVYDFNLAADVSAQTFLNIQGATFSVGLSAGLEGLAYGSVSKSLFALLSRGNRSGLSKTELAFGGGLFADAGFTFERQFGKLRFLVNPAIFLPVVYIPKPDISLSVRTLSNDVSISGKLAMEVYSPIRLGEGEEFGIDTSNLSELMGSGALGTDISLGAEYALTSFLDAGLLLSHIPLGSSRLHSQAQVSATFGFNNGTGEDEGSLFDQLLNGNIDEILNIEDPTVLYDQGKVIFVSRPLRFDLYAHIRLLGKNFLVLRPNAGLSLFTLYGSLPCFNAGLEGQINLGRLLSINGGSAYRELLWKHHLALTLNLRLVELNLGLNLRSQELAESFKLSGLGVSFGLRAGF